MNKEQKKYALFAGLILLGVLIGYFLFSGSTNFFSSSGGVCSSDTGDASVSETTEKGDFVCTEVCIRKPDDCRRPCPIGYNWGCEGTLAMTCGCFPNTPAGGTVIEENTDVPVCPDGMIYDTGRQTCITAQVI